VLLEVLTIALIGSICGADNYVDFADFARDREALFRDFLKLENGLPSHDTFSRLFHLLDPAAFAAWFARFLEGLGEAGCGVPAIDGKTLRRSFDRATSASLLQVVTAFACEARLVLGQVAIPSGGNEITAARAPLGLFDLTGMLVTGDAIHCQAETARLNKQRGGDWLFALKANRRTMLAEVTACFADPQAGFERQTTTDADHGRLETRRHSICRDVDWLFSDRRYPDEPSLPGLATLTMLEATTEPDGRTSTVRRYYTLLRHTQCGTVR
jgi:predicted transposase YbfD/YdcC